MFRLSIYILILANFSIQSQAADAELEMLFPDLDQELPLEDLLINNNWENNIPIDSNYHHCDSFYGNQIVYNQAPTIDYCPPQEPRGEKQEILVKACNIPAPEYIVPRIIPQPIFLNPPIYEGIYIPFNGPLMPYFPVNLEQPFEDSMDNDEIPGVSLERLPNGKSPVLRAFLISIEKKIGGIFINKKAGIIKITNFGALLDNVEQIYHSKNTIIRPNRVKALKPWFSGWPCRINFENSEFTLRVSKEKRTAYLKYFSPTESN